MRCNTCSTSLKPQQTFAMEVTFRYNACWRCLRFLTCKNVYGQPSCVCPPKELYSKDKANYVVRFRKCFLHGHEKANEALLAWLDSTSKAALPKGITYFNICASCSSRFYFEQKKGAEREFRSTLITCIHYVSNI